MQCKNRIFNRGMLCLLHGNGFVFCFGKNKRITLLMRSKVFSLLSSCTIYHERSVKAIVMF